MWTLRVREEDGMKKSKDTVERCVFCSYVIQLREDRTVLPSPIAVEIVETPNGPRALCANHARDAVRA